MKKKKNWKNTSKGPKILSYVYYDRYTMADNRSAFKVKTDHGPKRAFRPSLTVSQQRSETSGGTPRNVYAQRPHPRASDR